MFSKPTFATFFLATACVSIAGGQETLPAPADEPVVVGNLEHHGWALSGPRGRHYFFGGLAVADYTYQGERRIVTLQQEEPTLLPKPDKNFLYYRELESGHRWAIGREPLATGSYVVYYQRKGTPALSAADGASSAGKAKTWQEFQRSRLEWRKDEHPTGVPSGVKSREWTPRSK